MKYLDPEERNLELAKAICRQWIQDHRPETHGQGQVVRRYAELIRQATSHDNVYKTSRLRKGSGAYIDRI